MQHNKNTIILKQYISPGLISLEAITWGKYVIYIGGYEVATKRTQLTL